MRSTEGQHYVGLDHLRGVAASMVFVWHFTHAAKGYPVPFGFTPPMAAAPLALFDEGHVGVALFMTLSGYLFAKILDGKRIRYAPFFWNRILRLVPLLFLVLAINTSVAGARGESILLHLKKLAAGVLLPVLPNGGWSITVECHFYLFLPLLLWMVRKSVWLPLSVLVTASVLRWCLFAHSHDVQGVAYWTIVGRIDQFILGIAAFQVRQRISGRHAVALSVASSFSIFYWWFDREGGFYGTSRSALWIVMPTIEGFAFASLIAWYDTSFVFSDAGPSRFMGRIGTYSYSIYLLHFFWASRIAEWIDRHVMTLANFYIASAWALVVFVAMLPVNYLSFRFVESPFLRLRRHYVVKEPGAAMSPDARA